MLAPPQNVQPQVVLGEDERREIWAAVLANDSHSAGHVKTRPPRLPYERADVQIRATHPGGGYTSRTVYSHDLSAGGTSFLHPGYLHTGTAVQIMLPRRLGGEEHVSGRVTSCRYASGVWHAVGIKFDEPVSLKVFISPGDWENMPSAKAVRPEELAGDLLIIDDQEIDRMLMAHMLRQTRLKVTSATGMEQATRMVADVRYDLVVLDLNLGRREPSATQTVQELRQAGYAGPIVATSADLAPWVDRLRGMGIELSIAKPFDVAHLLPVLSAALNSNGGPEDAPLHSDLAGQDGMDNLLSQFCNRVGQLTAEMHQHVLAKDVEQVRLDCVTLRGSAGGYGFPTVSAAAAEAVKALDGSGDVDEAGVALSKLQALCRRMSARRPPPTTR